MVLVSENVSNFNLRKLHLCALLDSNDFLYIVGLPVHDKL